MKILLIQNALYIPSHGGANKANRALVEGLAGRGHSCCVLAPASGVVARRSSEQFLDELLLRGIPVSAATPDAITFQHNGVEVYATSDPAQLRVYALDLIRRFEPTWVLVPSEDPGQVLLEAALKAAPGRVVYIAHSSVMLPFGPMGFLPSQIKTEMLRRTSGIITVSTYLGDYMRRWGGLEATVIPFPVYGPEPFPHFGSFDRGFVTLINPCAVKGIAILLELARELPDVAFAAVPTWGTTEQDRAALQNLPNLRLLQPVDDIDELFAQTRVLLVPSLWDEAFGMIAVEAMVRGIPVLASDAGGLPEAMLGVDYVLPVRPIERYQERFDSRMNPVPVVPDQDLRPWLDALRNLLADRARYERLSSVGRAAALAFVARTSIAPFEDFLARLTQQERDGQRDAPRTQAQPATASGIHELVDTLSPERRALLAKRLKARGR